MRCVCVRAFAALFAAIPAEVAKNSSAVTALIEYHIVPGVAAKAASLHNGAHSPLAAPPLGGGDAAAPPAAQACGADTQPAQASACSRRWAPPCPRSRSS